MNGLMMPKTGRELVWNVLGKLQVSEHQKTVLREPRNDKRKWYGWWILGLLIKFQQIVSNSPNTQSIATKVEDKQLKYIQCNLLISCIVRDSLKKKLVKIIQYPLEPTHRGETKIVITLPTTPLLIGLRQPKRATNPINMLSNDS